MKIKVSKWTINKELNDLRKNIFVREKLKFLLKEFQFIESVKI